MQRRTFGKLILGAGVLAPMGFVRTAAAQPKPGDELVVGVWGGVQERIVREYCEKPLVEKYGCKVNYVLGGTGERRARAYAERGRPSFDVLYLNIYESRQAVRDRVTQAPTAAVERFDDLYDAAKIGGYGVAFNPVTIAYKGNRAKAPVTSWKDIWNPEWKGRIAWPQFPGMEGTAGLVMSSLVWGGDEKNMAPGFEKVKGLKPFAAIQASADSAWQMFSQDIADLTVEFGSLARKAQESTNPDIVIADPVEGQMAAMNFACITEGTANQKLAEEWINFHLSDACMQAYMKEAYYSPTVKSVTIPEALKGKILTAEQVDRLVKLDWEYVAAQQSAWSSRYTREIAG